MLNQLDTRRPSPVNGLVTHTGPLGGRLGGRAAARRVAGSAHPAAPADSGLVGCTALPGVQPAALSGYRMIGAQFAGPRWPGLRRSGVAYVEIAARLLSRHACGGRDRLVLPAAVCDLREAGNERQHWRQPMTGMPPPPRHGIVHDARRGRGGDCL